MSRYKDLKFGIHAEDFTNNAFKSVSNNIVSTASKFRNLRLSVANIKTIALSAIGGYFAKTVIDAGDRVHKLNQRLNISTEALSQYRHVAELTGTSFETWTNSMQKLNKRVAEAALNQGEAQQSLKELGIEAKAFSQLAPEDQFEIIADRLLDVENNSDKVRLAYKLFDDTGAELLQTIDGGSDALREMRQEAHDLGLTLSKDDVEAMAKLNDALTRTKNSFLGFAQKVLVKAAPSITKGIEKVQDAFETASVKIISSWNVLMDAFEIVVNDFLNGFRNIKKLAEDTKVVLSFIEEKMDFSNAPKNTSRAFMKLTDKMTNILSPTRAYGKMLIGISKASNAIGYDSPFIDYLQTQGEELNQTIMGMSDYLDYLDEIEKMQARAGGNGNSGIGNGKDFKRTEFSNEDIFGNGKIIEAEKERNRLLQLQKQLLQEIQTPLVDYHQKLSLINEVEREGLLTKKQSTELIEKANTKLREAQGTFNLTDALESTAQSAVKVGGILTNALGSAIDGVSQQIANFVLTGKANFAEMVKSIAAMVLQMTIKLLLLKAIMTATGMPTMPAGFAKGGVFSNGTNITAFANGGIVNSPTFFPMSGGRTGLMGEAGPEAIMPLTRGSNGKLGVKLYNKGNKNNPQAQQNISMSFNISSNSPEEFRRSQAEIEADMLAMMERAKRSG